MFKAYRPNKHHPCGASNCKCPVTHRLISRIRGHPYEVQTDNYKCGPVAIINGQHFLNRDAGRALRRVIITGCDSMPVHDDGFSGTKPNAMNNVITKVFSKDKIFHFKGCSECINGMERKDLNGYIVLYSYIKNKKQYFHYTFTYKIYNISEQEYYYYSQNDGSDNETILSFKDYLDEHFKVEGSLPIEYPQVWAIAAA